ncbi:hypothetical protein B0H11DRAFT_2260100 [Mycena galericulata]|nr:hypothetical protein B0H11DRAFT_2260100 [Mycena galericulata]
MPRYPVAGSPPTWIATLRWLLALLRNRLQKLPSGLKYVIPLLQIAAQRIRTTLFFCRKPDMGGGSGQDARILSSFDPGAGHELQIMSSRQPVEGGFDAILVGNALDPEASGAVPTCTPALQNLELNEAHETPGTAASSPVDDSVMRSSTSTATESWFASDRALGISKICAILPENFARYKCRETIPREPKEQQVAPQTFSFAPDKPPPGWIAPLHPEGARYFCHPERRIYTDVNICEAPNLANLNQVVDLLVDEIRASGYETAPYYAALFGKATHAVNTDLLVDLVIDLAPSDSRPDCGYYYFVNHSQRCPFWVHAYPADELRLWDTIQGPIAKEQLRHAMEHQYWRHCTLFPNALSLTQQYVEELLDSIIFSIGDMSTSLTSTVTRTTEELKTWLSVANQLQYPSPSNPDSSPSSLLLGSTSTFARLMEQFAQDRFDNFHGLPWARLNQDQSVYEEQKHPQSYLMMNRLISIISPFLFFAPDVYLRSLQPAYVDRRVILRVWKPLIDKLNSEWQDFILIATVFLNINVSFLQINSVDTLTASGRHTPVQIFCYLSILCSGASIILALLLVRQTRTKFNESASDMSASLHRRNSETFGLKILAVIFSLPYALLIWSTVFFFVALLMTCMRPHDTVSQSTVGVAVATMSTLVLWCIWEAWDMESAAYKPPVLFTLKNAIHSCLHFVLPHTLSMKQSSTMSTGLERSNSMRKKPRRRLTKLFSSQTKEGEIDIV